MQIQLILDSLIALRKISLTPANAPSTSDSEPSVEDRTPRKLSIEDHIDIINTQINSNSPRGGIRVEFNLMTNDASSLLEQTGANILILFKALYSGIEETLHTQPNPSRQLNILIPFIALSEFLEDDPILTSIFSTEEYVSLVQFIECLTGYWYAELKKKPTLERSDATKNYSQADDSALLNLITSLLTQNTGEELLSEPSKNISQNAFVIIKYCFFELVGILSNPENQASPELLKNCVSRMTECLEERISPGTVNKILATKEYQYFLEALAKFMKLSVDDLKNPKSDIYHPISGLAEQYGFSYPSLVRLINSWVVTPGQLPHSLLSRSSSNWLLPSPPVFYTSQSQSRSSAPPTGSLSSRNSNSSPSNPSYEETSSLPPPPINMILVEQNELDDENDAVSGNQINSGGISSDERQKLLKICDEYLEYLQDKIWSEVSDVNKLYGLGLKKEEILPGNYAKVDEVFERVWASKKCPSSISSLNSLQASIKGKITALIEIRSQIQDPNITKSSLKALIEKNKEGTLGQHRDNAFMRGIGIVLSIFTFAVTYPIAFAITGSVWGYLMDSRGETACNKMLEILNTKPEPEMAPACRLRW